MSFSNLIKKDDCILLVDNRNEKRLLKISDNRKFKWRKIAIDLNQLVKYEYGTTFEIENGILKVSEPLEIQSQQQSEHLQKTDNREIFVQNTTAQKLEQQQIQQLKKVTLDRNNLIAVIAENNQQFQKRTAYSKEKYLKKKKAKYLFTFAVYKATIQNVADYYFNQEAKAISYFRWDTLGLYLHYGGIGQNMLLIEKTKGLIAGALVLKGANKVTLINEERKNPSKMLIYQQLNIPKQLNEKICSLKFEEVLKTENLYTNLMIAGDFQSSEFIQKLNPKIQIGGIVTIYSKFLEPLTRTFDLMLSLKTFIHIQLFDTFTRKYQVLKNRTHPMMSMDGFGGYILIAIKVQEK